MGDEGGRPIYPTSSLASGKNGLTRERTLTLKYPKHESPRGNVQGKSPQTEAQRLYAENLELRELLCSDLIFSAQ